MSSRPNSGRRALAVISGVLVAASSLLWAGAPVHAAPVAPVIDIGASTVGDDTVQLAWDQVAGDDDTAIYTAVAIGTNPVRSCQVTDDTTSDPVSCVITGLVNGTAYSFQVSVTSSSGSATSTITGTLTPRAIPTAPSISTVTEGNARLYVAWTAPTDWGGSTSGATYSVLINDDTTNCNAVAFGTNSCIVTQRGPSASALVNNTAYTIKVAATNGQSLTSSPSTGVAATPGANKGLPSTPSTPLATLTGAAGSKAIEVAFIPAAVEPTGFPVANFTATCTSSDGGSGPLTATGTSSPLSVSGLTAGKTYSCMVKATNANGDSVGSGASNAVVVNDSNTLGAPTSPSASGGAGQATVSWTPPSPATGLTGYQVRYQSTAPGSTWSLPISTGSTTASYVVTGLSAGNYTFQVRSVSSAGASAWSAATAATTVTAGAIGVPTAVAGVAGTGQVALSWTAPTSGSTPTGYEVRYSSNNGTSWSTPEATGSTGTTFTVTGLTNGTSYIFGVRVVAGGSTGNWSANSAAVTPGAPGTPGTPSGSAASEQVVLTWTAPAVATGTPVPTGYQVRYSSNGGTTWTESTAVNTTALTQTVTGLTNGSTYVFAVRALNGTAQGAWSSTSTAVVLGPPAAPTSVAGTAGNASVALTWTAPAGSPVATGYDVRYSSNNGSTWTVAPAATGTATSRQVTGLTNGSTYVFQVRALNGTFSGAWSESSAQITPEGDVVLSIDLTRANRNPAGLIVVRGETTGLEEGDKINIRVRVYNPKAEAYRKARTVATVEVNRLGRFRYTFENSKRLLVIATIPGEASSESVEVPRA